MLRGAVALAVGGGAWTASAASPTVVDSHQHFWDRAVLHVPPPSAGEEVLTGPFLPADLRPELVKAGVNRTVLVQGFPQTQEGNRWLFVQANATDYIAGVVAWMDLQGPSHAGATLDQLRKEPKFVGIRHIVEEEPDVDWIVRPPVLESLRELARRNVRFDMLARPRHLSNVLKVLDRVPDLRMVVDHIAKPEIARGGTPGWKEHMTAIAQRPRVYCKLSGMITEANRRQWKPADLKPYVQHVTAAFGWDRVMYGSDWPVCLLAGSYQQVWQAIHEALGNITSAQRDQVFGANAVRFYGLKI